MGQDRSQQPNLRDVLSEAGLKRGDRIGIVGWKYARKPGMGRTRACILRAGHLVAILARVAGERSRLTDATPSSCMRRADLRAAIDADQIAAHEWGMARASAALWRIVSGIRVGDSELSAAGRMGYAGEALTAHVMLATGDKIRR